MLDFRKHQSAGKRKRRNPATSPLSKTPSPFVGNDVHVGQFTWILKRTICRRQGQLDFSRDTQLITMRLTCLDDRPTCSQNPWFVAYHSGPERLTYTSTSWSPIDLHQPKRCKHQDNGRIWKAEEPPRSHLPNPNKSCCCNDNNTLCVSTIIQNNSKFADIIERH